MYHPSPRYVQFFPTVRCNYGCAFCFNRGMSPVDDVSVVAFERFLTVLSEIGVEEIDMLGGEPSLHPHLPALIDVCGEKKMKITMSTNGSNVGLLRVLSEKYGSDFLSLGVSINGDTLSKDLDEYIRRHRPLLKGICTKERTLPGGVKEYLALPGIRYYVIYMDTPFPEDLRYGLPFFSFLERVRALREVSRNVDAVYCSGFVPDSEHYPVLERVRCPAGTTKISVMPDGSVYPCYLFARHREFRLGNLVTDDFTTMWQNPLLDFFRRFQENRCVNSWCRLFSRCHGGCPAMSLLICGDLGAPDPRCLLEG